MAQKLIKLNQTKCCGGAKVLACDSHESGDISMLCACMLNTYTDPMRSHIRILNYVGLCRA